MQEYNTHEKVYELLKDKEGTGNENCYFLALQDFVRAPMNTGGGFKCGIDFPYDAVLFNKTEHGIGMFYLKQSKIGLLKSSKEDFILDGEYLFTPNEDIAKVTVKNHSIFNKKVKSIIIKTVDRKIHRLLVNIDEPLLPYHKHNFEKFMNLYSK